MHVIRKGQDQTGQHPYNILINVIAEMAKEAQARVVLDKRQVLMVENNVDFSAAALTRLNKALPQVTVTAAAAQK